MVMEELTAPDALLAAIATLRVSTKTSTAALASKPLPVTVSVLVGGPAVDDNDVAGAALAVAAVKAIINATIGTTPSFLMEITPPSRPGSHARRRRPRAYEPPAHRVNDS